MIWQHCTQNGWLDQLRRVFNEWVASDYNWRKHLSYFGALKRSRQTDPCGWTDTDGEVKTKFLVELGYFDPGNNHYKECAEALIGPLEWNQCTVGDIMESLLGLRYLAKERGISSCYFPKSFVLFLHNWCLAVYRYNQSLGWTPYAEVFARIKHASLSASVVVVD